MNHTRIQQVIYVLIAFGVALHLKEAFWESSEPLSTFSIGIFLWSLAPYMVILTLRKWLYGALCAVVLVFIVDLWIYLEVFVFPGSSTASLGLLFIPLWNLLLTIPLSFFIGSKIAKRKS